MRLPSKITSYKESSLSKFSYVLNVLQNGPVDVMTLYKQTSNIIASLDEFIEVLDSLYALKAIEFNKDRGEIEYVKGN